MTSRAATPPELAGCAASGDCLHAYEAHGRRIWASRCFPEFQHEIEMRSVWLDEDETPRAAYPTFGSGDGTQVHWYAPTDPNAACDLPSDYRLTGYLFRERATRLTSYPRG